MPSGRDLFQGNPYILQKDNPKTLSGSIPSLSPISYTMKGISEKGPELVSTLMAVCPITSQMLKSVKRRDDAAQLKNNFYYIRLFL